MPTFRKHNDAVRYKSSYGFYAKSDFSKLTELCDKIASTSGYRMVTFDTMSSYIYDTLLNNKEVIAKVTIPEEWK